MGLLHLHYLLDEDQYLVCACCLTHLASVDQEYQDNLLLGGVSSHFRVRDLVNFKFEKLSKPTSSTSTTLLFHHFKLLIKCLYCLSPVGSVSLASQVARVEECELDRETSMSFITQGIIDFSSIVFEEGMTRLEKAKGVKTVKIKKVNN